MIMYLFDPRDILAGGGGGGGGICIHIANSCVTVVTINFVCRNSA